MYHKVSNISPHKIWYNPFHHDFKLRFRIHSEIGFFFVGRKARNRGINRAYVTEQTKQTDTATFLWKSKTSNNMLLRVNMIVTVFGTDTKWNCIPFAFYYILFRCYWLFVLLVVYGRGNATYSCCKYHSIVSGCCFFFFFSDWLRCLHKKKDAHSILIIRYHRMFRIRRCFRL